MHLDEKKIQERAHQLWEREGRPEGAAQSHWKQAAEEIRSEAETATESDTPRAVSGGVESGVAQPMPKP